MDTIPSRRSYGRSAGAMNPPGRPRPHRSIADPLLEPSRPTATVSIISSFATSERASINRCVVGGVCGLLITQIKNHALIIRMGI